MSTDRTIPAERSTPAIARGAAILRLLGRSDEPMGVNAIARETGLVPSTCLYLLRALAKEELVAFDAVSKLYSLDAGVLTLARGWLRRNQFSDLAQPLLDRLAHDHGVTLLAVQMAGLDHMIVVAKAEGGTNFQLSAQIGSRFPALISATGRCMAAFGCYAEADLLARFEKLRWDNPPSADDWLAQIASTRDQGYAVDNGNYIIGVTVIAAPVGRAGDRPSHAIVAIGISEAVSRIGETELGQALVRSALMLGRQL